MPQRGRKKGPLNGNKGSNNRITFYKKGEKERQRYLINNHSAVTGFLIGILSTHFNILISYPIRMSFSTLTFPRLKIIYLNEYEEIPFAKIIKDRLNAFKNEINSGREIPLLDARLNFVSHYQNYHMIYDILTFIEDLEIYDETEEPSGLSGDYKIRFKERIYNWEEIDKRGRDIIERIYKDRAKGERRRIVKKGQLSDLLL